MSNRREFIKTAVGLCGAACGIVLLESCTNVKYIQGSVSGQNLIVSKTELAESKFVVVRSDKTEAPVYLSVTEEGYSALLMLCTHKQCELKPTGNFLTCPCHGSEFSNKGKVLKEPADKDLLQYKVTQDTNNIYIHLK